MGDKSPKSKQKDKNQKQTKATTAENKKQKAIANKKGPAPGKWGCPRDR